MNDFFSFSRFRHLLKKTLLERPVQLTGLAGLTLLVTTLLYTVCKMFLPFEEAQNLAFVLGFVGGGSLLASYTFAYFTSTATGSSYLTLPASDFEKWICGILITGVFFTTIFLLYFSALDIILVKLYQNGLDPADPYYSEKFNAVHRFPLTGFVASKIYIMFINVAGLMFIASLYFNKSSFIKCALIICCFFIGAHFLNQLIANLIFDSVDKALLFYGIFIPVGKEIGKLVLPLWASRTIDILMYVYPVLLWSLAWLRLREKEF